MRYVSGLGQAVAHARTGLYQILAGTGTPTPDVYNPLDHPSAPKEVTDKVDPLLNLLGWFGLVVAVVGVMIAAFMMILSHHRGGGGEHMARLGYVAGGIMLLGTASALVGFIL